MAETTSRTITATMKFGNYDGSPTRTITWKDVGASAYGQVAKNTAKAINASLAAGTDGGLGEFFSIYNDDYDLQPFTKITKLKGKYEISEELT